MFTSLLFFFVFIVLSFAPLLALPLLATSLVIAPVPKLLLTLDYPEQAAGRVWAQAASVGPQGGQ